MNLDRMNARVNFAKMWQMIARHRYRMTQEYLAAGQLDYAIKMQQDTADAHYVMRHYLERLQNG